MDLLWDIRVSLDLFLGGMGIGVFLIGTLLYYLDSEGYAASVRRALLVAPVMVIAGLVLLLTEIGRPLNALKTLYTANPMSMMSLGVFLQLCFVVIAALLAYSALRKGVPSLVPGLVWCGAALAGLVGLYHGFLLTGINRSPWSDAIPVIFFISSLLAGFALLFLFDLKGLEQKLGQWKLPVILNLILTLELVAVFAWVYNLGLNSDASRLAYNVLMDRFGFEFWGLAVLIGLIVPLGLFTLVLLKKVSFKAVFVPAAVAMIAGSFFLKNLVVYLGQAV